MCKLYTGRNDSTYTFVVKGVEGQTHAGRRTNGLRYVGRNLHVGRFRDDGGAAAAADTSSTCLDGCDSPVAHQQQRWRHRKHTRLAHINEPPRAPWLDNGCDMLRFRLVVEAPPIGISSRSWPLDLYSFRCGNRILGLYS